MNNFCPKCGHQIMPGSNLCHNCGNNMAPTQVYQPQVTTVNTGHLVINRQKSFVGCAIAIHITINGVPYELNNNSQLVFDLAPGSYQVNYKVWCRREKSVIINVHAGGNYLVDFVVDPIWGGFKIGDGSILG